MHKCLSKPLPGTTINPVHPLAQDLIGFWLFNEGEGSLINDISGNGNHGSLVNMLPNTQGSGWTGSVSGNAIAFDGVNNYIDCGSDASMSVTDKLSIEAWVIKDALHAGALDEVVAKGWDYIMEFDDTQIYMFSHDPVGGVSTYAAYAYSAYVGKLTQIIGTIDASVSPQVRLYLNGNMVDTGNNAAFTQIGAGTSTMYMGDNSAAVRFFSGEMCLIRMYNKILAPFEIKQLYNNPYCMIN